MAQEVESVRTTHSAMFLSAIRSLCARRQPMVPVEKIELRDAHFLPTGSCAYFVDEETGQRYRLVVEAVS